MIEVDVKLDLRTLKLWSDNVASQLSSSQDGELRKVFKKWAIRYRSYVQLRFDKASKGDGTWQPLAPSTVAGRRKQSSTILRDTGTLFAALAPIWTAPAGSINEMIEDGVRVGFGGPSSHPSGLVTIAQIAAFHQAGGGNLPKREIIVQPSDAVLRGCASDLQEFLNRAQ